MYFCFTNPLCFMDIDFASFSLFLLDFGTVQTVCYFFVFTVNNTSNLQILYIIVYHSVDEAYSYQTAWLYAEINRYKN